MPSDATPTQQRRVTQVAHPPVLRVETLAVTAAPDLDEAQRRVVEHRGGPLLVLAGPGTGKTTTLVEAMIDRVVGPGALQPQQVLGLTFGRHAASTWRERVTARLGGGLLPTVATFHSLAYSLVRAERVEARVLTPLRLLSAAEQEQRMRELLVESIDGSRIPWPEALRDALPTRTFATALRRLLAHVRLSGLDPADLARLAEAEGGPHAVLWGAAARFLGDYLDVLDLSDVVDYTEVIHRATLIAERDPAVGRRYRCVLVDEYQDTDPGQIRLLRALTGAGCDLVVVGDPDQAVYDFRGADSRGILDFPDTFRASGGSPAPVVVLDTCRRFGARLRTPVARLIERTTLAPLPIDVQRHHREVRAVDTSADLEVLLFDTASAEAAHIAGWLRRHHHDEHVPWDRMAVIIRSTASLPRLRRGLVDAGIPVAVAADEILLATEPALLPILEVLRLVTDDGPVTHRLTSEALASLVCSEIGGADPSDLRALGRALRSHQRRTAAVASPSGELLLVRFDEMVSGRNVEAAPLATTARRADAALFRLSRAVRTAAALRDGLVYDVVWAVWSSTTADAGGTGWPDRLEAAARRGGADGRRADADLDAVLALFATAERSDERFQGRQGLRSFLDDVQDQHVAIDTLAERAAAPPAVRLLTAHRAKGGEWEVVAVAGVQEQTWPDLREPAGQLGLRALSQALGRHDAPSALLQERRLFYVACTRARRALLVTAVNTSGDDGPTASRFMSELLDADVPRAGEMAEGASGRVALVSELRRVVGDPGGDDAIRAAAAARLVRLADIVDDMGVPLCPSADHTTWWGTHEPTRAAAPLRPTPTPVELSGSQLSSIERCPLRWLLDHEARARSPQTTSMGVGSVIHAIADAVTRGTLPAERDAIETELDGVWHGLVFTTAWESTVERRAASAAMAAFLNWHLASPEKPVASEQEFITDLDLGAAGVRIRGRMDRVELTPEGIEVFDLKTGKNPASVDDVTDDLQLGVYQLAVRSGGFTDPLAPDWLRTPETPAGASLVYLRKVGAKGVTTRQQRPLGDQTWVDEAVVRAEDVIRREVFEARPGDHCRSCPARSACPAVDEGRSAL